MRRAVAFLLLVSGVALLAIAAYTFWPQIEFYKLTGSLCPIRKIDRLQRSVGVTGWSEEQLVFADGRTAKLPGIRKLPLKSEGLTAATRRGVEIAPDGRIFGLVTIHHCCGNDPVREHVARVDVSELLLFLGDGEPVSKWPPEEQGLEQRGGTFSRFGWDVGEFGVFETWQELCQLYRESTQ